MKQVTLFRDDVARVRFNGEHLEIERGPGEAPYIADIWDGVDAQGVPTSLIVVGYIQPESALIAREGESLQ